MKFNRSLVFALPLLTLSATVTAVPYDDGFVWNKYADYTTGSTTTDQAGNEAWSYEYFNGWGNWDNTLALPYNSSNGRWANKYGNISKWDQNRHFHSSSNEKYPYSPLVRWINPTNEVIDVSVGGALELLWLGKDWDATNKKWSDYTISGVMDIDVVLGFYDASAGNSSILIDERVLYPASGEVTCKIPTAPTLRDCPNAMLSTAFDLTLDVGDSLFWTSTQATPYADGNTKNRWLTLNDRQLTITLNKPSTAIPEPPTLALMGIALLGAGFVARKAKSKH